jgi:hypothetical protein
MAERENPLDRKDTEMQYLLLIYSNEKDWDALPEAEWRKVLGEYHDFTESIRASGHYRAGEALEATRTARTVRLRDGQVLTTDGPFAETKEQLGGFYLIEATPEDAVEIAGRIPSARVGSIEIRPIMPTH